MLRPVGTVEVNVIRTPLIADAWEAALAETGLLHTYSDVVTSLREGFHLGMSTTVERR